jgi:DNA-binding CsgD family transcriptional regulator/predicted DNA-binding protein (UPF0251 family)
MKNRQSSPSQLGLFNAHRPTLDEDDEIDPRPEILCYRGQTFAMVRHFFEISSQVGRLPSLLGREFFRARVTHHAIPSFEDQAVFVRDVELCFARLSEPHAEMITLVALYSFSRDEVAQMLRVSRTWVNHRVAEALDALSEIFLQGRLLRADRPDRRQSQVTSRSIPLDIVAPYGSHSGPAVRGGRARKPVLRAQQPPAERCQAIPSWVEVGKILKLLAGGNSVKAIAVLLGLIVKTLEAHKFNLMRKLDIHNKAQLVTYAIQKKIIKVPMAQ